MPSSPPPTTPVRQRRKEARPQELLDAALALFVEKGFAATKSEEVAVRAGVSKGTLYLYYPSKEELLKAVIRENLSQLIAEGSGIADGFEGSMADLLTLLIDTWWQRVGNTPASGIHKIMMSEVRNFPEIGEFYQREVIEPAEQLLQRTLERGIERGEFRPIAVKEVTMVLFAPMIFMALHKHSIGACTPMTDADMDRVIAAHIDLVQKGLAAEPAPTKPAPVSKPTRKRP
jgi:TetR/AcrR family transcriptional regulator